MVIPEAFKAEELERLQAAWLRAQAPHRAAFKAATQSVGDASVSALPSGEAKVSGGQRADLFFDIPQVTSSNHTQLFVMCRPSLTDCLRYQDARRLVERGALAHGTPRNRRAAALL